MDPLDRKSPIPKVALLGMAMMALGVCIVVWYPFPGSVLMVFGFVMGIFPNRE